MVNYGMVSSKLYEFYHRDRRLPRKIINEFDFTYINIVNVINRYLYKKKSRILDVGCGVGTISLYLASKGCIVDGLDISARAIQIANESSKKLKIRNIYFKRQNFEEYLSRKEYDVIIISEVLEHLKNDVKVIQKIHSLVKDGGRVLITVPSKKAPLYRLGLLKKFDKDVGHLRRYSERSIQDKLVNNGFKVIKLFKSEGLIRNIFFTNRIIGFFLKLVFGKIAFWLNEIDKSTIPIFGESQIIVIATKVK